eukprot:3572188-Prymnesium_polylepis.1
MPFGLASPPTLSGRPQPLLTCRPPLFACVCALVPPTPFSQYHVLTSDASADPFFAVSRADIGRIRRPAHPLPNLSDGGGLLGVLRL